MSRGFHPTALSGVFGSSTAAAVLLGMSAEQLRSTWGIVTSMASGSMAFTEDASGTMVKRLHAGWPAYSGVLASQLVRLGFTGPQNTLDSKTGFISMFSPAPDRTGLTRSLGERWALDEISIKPYACCRFFHALIDALEESRRNDRWAGNDVASLTAFGPRMMVDGHLEYRPKSVMAAQYSLPYTVAVAITGNARDPASFSDSAMHDPGLLGLADRVDARIDPELDAMFPKKFPAGFEVRLKDGRELRCVVTDSVGTRERPMGREQIVEKFLSITADILSHERQMQLLDTVVGFDRLDDVGVLTRQLEELDV